MYNFSVPVDVKAVAQNARIFVEWSADGTPTPIEWIHASTGWHNVRQRDEQRFSGSEAEAMQHALDATEGFAFVLAGAKALLEHNVKLNLVPDRFPNGLGLTAKGYHERANSKRLSHTHATAARRRVKGLCKLPPRQSPGQPLR